MGNEKMREAFELSYAKKWQTVSSAASQYSIEHLCAELKEMRNGDKYGHGQDYLNFMWEGWQAATAATQRGAMAVAEAVLDAAGDHFSGKSEKPIDLAAIVEAVRPGKQEPVTWGSPKTVKHLIRQLQTMEPEMPVHGAIFVDVDGKRVPRIRPLSLSRERVDGQWIKQGDESIPYQLVAWTAEQPASAQQQGEPVAWGAFNFATGKLYNHCETEPQIKTYIDTVHQSRDDITLTAKPLYTAPPAPACCVPDGYALAPMEPTWEMITAYDADASEFASKHLILRSYKVMLAAAPKPERGAV